VPELIAVVREIVAADPKDPGWNIYLAELLYTAEDFGISNGAGLREEAKPMIAKLTTQFPNEQKPYILKSWVCEDKSGFTANCMQDLVQCLRVNPQNNECRHSLQSMAAGYQAPRCDAASIKPSLVFRETNSTSAGAAYSIPARSLLDEVIRRPLTPNTNTDPGVLANMKRDQLDGYSNCTERLAHSGVGEVGLFDGKKKLFSAHPKNRINTWRMQFEIPIADICARVEQRRLPDDVAQALVPVQ